MEDFLCIERPFVTRLFTYSVPRKQSRVPSVMLKNLEVPMVVPGPNRLQCLPFPTKSFEERINSRSFVKGVWYGRLDFVMKYADVIYTFGRSDFLCCINV